ncbi:MAG: hypothetical protein AB7S67_10325 [Thiomonas sp.]
MSSSTAAELDLGIHTQPPQHLDFSETQHPLEVLAHEGAAAAQERLGALYYRGLGKPQDADKALQWWERAAAQGEERAIKNLALLAKGVRR